MIARATRPAWQRTAAVIAALWVSCSCVASASAQDSSRSAAELMDAVMWNREPIGGPFELVDQAGQTRTERDFHGKLLLVYFGFTFCPDICPTDLQAIGLAMDRLGPDAVNVQPLFITLDPERDTSEHLAQYVPMFHPQLVGLTGRTPAIQKAAAAYRVYHRRVQYEKSEADYTVDHSAFIYLMDRDGKYLGFFPPGTSADQIVGMIWPHLGAASAR